MYRETHEARATTNRWNRSQRTLPKEAVGASTRRIRPAGPRKQEPPDPTQRMQLPAPREVGQRPVCSSKRRTAAHRVLGSMDGQSRCLFGAEAWKSYRTILKCCVYWGAIAHLCWEDYSTAPASRMPKQYVESSWQAACYLEKPRYMRLAQCLPCTQRAAGPLPAGQTRSVEICGGRHWGALASWSTTTWSICSSSERLYSGLQRNYSPARPHMEHAAVYMPIRRSHFTRKPNRCDRLEPAFSCTWASTRNGIKYYTQPRAWGCMGECALIFLYATLTDEASVTQPHVRHTKKLD